MNIFLEYLKVFLIGGAFCILAQIIIDKTKLTPARILVGYVVLGVILTGFGVYEPLVNFAKSGATVPLTGFGYMLAKGVQKAVSEKGLIGVLTGGFSAAASGIASVVTLGVISSLLFSSKEK